LSEILYPNQRTKSNPNGRVIVNDQWLIVWNKEEKEKEKNT